MRPIDLFGGRGCDSEMRAIRCGNIDVKTITTGNTACRVHENCRKTLLFGRGKAHTQRTGFMQFAPPGCTIFHMHVKFHGANRPVGREGLR